MLSRLFPIVVALILVIPLSAAAEGVDGEVNLNWWFNDVELDAFDGDFDAGSAGGSASLWWDERWGVKAALYRSDADLAGDFGDVDYFSLDLKRRVVSLGENNYLALGAGWQRLGLSNGGDSDGLRLVLDGRVGLSQLIYLYGQGAWLPIFSDTDIQTDIDGFEFEAGLGISPLPLIHFTAGWRQFRFDSSGPAGGATKSSGVIVGAGIHW